jgi:hypothetical protein
MRTARRKLRAERASPALCVQPQGLAVPAERVQPTRPALSEEHAGSTKCVRPTGRALPEGHPVPAECARPTRPALQERHAPAQWVPRTRHALSPERALPPRGNSR